MDDDSSKSHVEITVGASQIRIEGSESFISKELSTVLDKVNLANSTESEYTEEGTEDGTQSTLPGVTSKPVEVEKKSSKVAETNTVLEVDNRLVEVANRINVDAEALAEHFYLNGDDIHIQDPLNIEARYAVLGYCTIREELEGEPYHDNTETKKKLIDIEKVDIKDWGGNLLYDLRQGGLIKDDPNTSKERSKPFQITPTGRRELIEWLNE